MQGLLKKAVLQNIYKKPRQKNKMTDSYFLQQKTHRIVVLKNDKYFITRHKKENKSKTHSQK